MDQKTLRQELKELDQKIEDNFEQIKNRIDELEDGLEKVKDIIRFVNPESIASKTSHHDFQVGDRVQFKSWDEMEKEDIAFYGMSCSDMKELAGSYATIEKVNETYPKTVKLIRCSANKNNEHWEKYYFNPDLFKPAIDEPKGKIKITELDLSELRNPKCKFKVGDKVKINKSYSFYYNKVGTILKLPVGDDYLVEMETGEELYFEEKFLEPYTETRWTFTDDEKVILKNLPEEYKWIARHKDGNLCCVCGEKPEKWGDIWSHNNGRTTGMGYFSHLFQSIKWEDETACEFRKYL